MQERHLAVKPKQRGRTSALGHKQELETALEMSALPTKAGMFSRGIDVG